MKKIIAIGGAPGTGKSTLMKNVMSTLSPLQWEYNTETKLVPYYKKNNIYVLGYYPEGEVFGGTDKMSMACQPEVLKFINSLPDDAIVLFEGDRLFNNSFLDFCSKFDLNIFILNTSKEEKQKRYEKRGSDQNEKWLEGRVTKVNNIASNLELMDRIETYDHMNEHDTKRITNYIMELII